MTSTRVTEVDGVRISQIQSVSDNRGAFFKFHPLSEINNPPDSIAFSSNPNTGTLRGLHFQVNPFAEEKLITCIQGAVYDVIVDLRPSSRTFGKWTSFELSGTNLLQIYLPKGIAHGFQTLEPNSIVHYCLSASYAPEHSYVINPYGDLDISWPLETIHVSDKDKNGLTFFAGAQKYAESLEHR